MKGSDLDDSRFCVSKNVYMYIYVCKNGLWDGRIV